MANKETNPFRIYEDGVEILDSIKAVFEANEVSLPERQYFAVGPENTVAYDCEQLTITHKNIADGMEYNDVPRKLSCGSVFSGIFYVELVRCIPSFSGSRSGKLKADIPDAEALDNFAKDMMRDAFLMKRVAEIVNDYSNGSVLYSVSYSEPSGSYQSVQLSIKRTL